MGSVGRTVLSSISNSYLIHFSFSVSGVFIASQRFDAFGLFAKIPTVWLDVISITLTALLIADVAISAGVLTKIRGAAESVRADNTEAITKAVREALMALVCRQR